MQTPPRSSPAAPATPPTPAPAGPEADATAPAEVSFGQALRFWAWLGCVSFGGPAGQIAILHTELVERRRWISERRFLHALNYCMLLPGPEAQQLVTYIGWLLHRRLGGVVAGTLFVLPALVLLIALSWVYLRFGQQPVVAGVFAGLKPAVVALVAHAAHRLGTRALKHPALWGLALAAFIAIDVVGVPFPAIVLAAGAIGWLGARWAPQVFGASGAAHAPGPAAGSLRRALIDDDTPPPAHARVSRAGLLRVLAAGLGLWGALMGLLLATQGWQGTLTQMGWFFTQAALLTFGGAYAVLPFVVQGAVEQHQWLSAAQMIDGLALGESTPGPLIMVVAFVGYLGGWQAAVLGPEARAAGGALAAVVVTVVTFLPSFVFILAGGPLVEATRGRLGFTAPLTAISAAVVGVIASLALFFALHVLWPAGLAAGPDLWALAVAAGAALALWRWRVGVLPVLAACALLGLLRALLVG